MCRVRRVQRAGTGAAAHGGRCHPGRRSVLNGHLTAASR